MAERNQDGFQVSPVEHLLAAERLLLQVRPAIERDTVAPGSKVALAQALISLAETMATVGQVDDLRADDVDFAELLDFEASWRASHDRFRKHLDR